jgi:glycine cleavage system H protein
VSDLFLPLAGEIVEFNDFRKYPEAVNADPMVLVDKKIKVSDVEMILLLSSDAYKELIGA